MEINGAQAVVTGAAGVFAVRCEAGEMPRRQRTRAAERAARIAWERGVNRARIEAHPPPPF